MWREKRLPLNCPLGQVLEQKVSQSVMGCIAGRTVRSQEAERNLCRRLEKESSERFFSCFFKRSSGRQIMIMDFIIIVEEIISILLIDYLP